MFTKHPFSPCGRFYVDFWNPINNMIIFWDNFTIFGIIFLDNFTTLFLKFKQTHFSTSPDVMLFMFCTYLSIVC